MDLLCKEVSRLQKMKGNKMVMIGNLLKVEITPGGQDGRKEAGGGGLIGQEDEPGGADGEAEVGPRTRSKTKRLRIFK